MGDISKDIVTNFNDDRIKAFVNIKYTADYLNANEAEFLKPFGISPQQYNILRILRGAKGKIKVQDVKDRMIEKSTNLARLMDKLLGRSLIVRSRFEKDKRVIFVEITKEGLFLLERIDSEMINFSILEKLTEKEASQLSKLLDKIR